MLNAIRQFAKRKKIIYIFILFFITFCSLSFSGYDYTDIKINNFPPSGTYLFEEFESGAFPPYSPLGSWTLTGNTNLWGRATTASGYGIGISSAMANFQTISSGYQNLISPVFTPSSSGDSVKFDHAYATWTSQNDQLAIYTTTNSGTNWTLLILLNGGVSGPLNTGGAVNTGTFIPTSSQWATKKYALPVGTNMVEFRAISAYGNNLYIDNVQIGSAFDNDVGISRIDIPQTANQRGAIVPKAIIKNFGKNVQTFNVTMKITPGSYTSQRTVTNLSSNTLSTVSFDSWNQSPNGIYIVKVYTELINDENKSNDTLIKSTTSLYSRDQVVIAAEYFINNDPGEGSGINIPGNFNQTDVTVNLSNINLPVVSKLYLRYKSSNGKWSAPVAVKRLDYFVNYQATLVYGEYFINNDPGKGNGTSVVIQSDGKMDITNLKIKRGDKIFVRVKDSYGRWSPAKYVKFNFNDITDAKYKLGLNGQQLGMNLSLPNDSSSIFTASKNNVFLTSNDTLYVRMQTSDRLYSQWVKSPLIIIALVPVLLTPENNSLIQGLTPILDWENVSGALRYRVQISDDSLFAYKIIDSSGITLSQFQVSAGVLSPNTTYFWRVNSGNSYMTSSFSPARKFRTMCPVTWKMTLTMSDAGSVKTDAGTIKTYNENLNKDATNGKSLTTSVKDSIVFALSPEGTNGIDNCLGEYELPPIPVQGNFDLRFLLPLSPVLGTRIDYRNDTNQTISWIIKFQPSISGYPLTFTWNSSLFPPSSRFFLKDTINGSFVNVNMKSQNSYILTNQTISCLKIEYKYLISVPLSFGTDWNLLSAPVLADSMEVIKVFPLSVSQAFKFNNGYQPVNTLENGIGYFINMSNVGTVNIIGSIIKPREIPAISGWNIIGPFEYTLSTSGIASNPPGIIVSNFFGFNNGYQPAPTLYPGKGYWVKLSQAGTLLLPPSVNKKTLNDEEITDNSAVKKSGTTSWETIEFTDSRNRNTRLYLAEKRTMTQLSYEMPPAPPGGLFDVRFLNGNYAEPIGKSPYIVKINSAEYPLKIKVTNLSGNSLVIMDNIDGSLLNKTLKEGDEIIVKENLESIVISECLIPLTYDLSQNYPNPFNPVTTIKYQIPKDVIVKIKIYDVLGREIKVLVDGLKEAGFYEIKLDVKNFSSGAYFYRMEAGNYTNIKKMVVLK